MKQVYIASDNIITSLGFSTKENCAQIKEGVVGLKIIDDITLSPVPFYASQINSEKLDARFEKIEHPEHYTRFEKLAILSISDALSKTNIDVTSDKTIFILSTTKGNIDILSNNGLSKFGERRLYLWEIAKLLQWFFTSPNTPNVVSNACVSGVLAIIIGSRLIRSGQYENAVVTGGDILSKFVVSGFQSLQALSGSPCRPFDKSRDGLSLGEGCGTVILTSNEKVVNESNPVVVGGGFSSNDANHISGPSRTGEGLLLAIQKTLNDPLSAAAGEVSYVSAHGTATPYNDEMESIALSRAGLEQVPVNSMKGYWGHTLGAAGVIESISSIYSLKNNVLFKTAGFKELGVTNKINIIEKTEEKKLNTCLKIASGFGGCNTGVLFYKT
ncbi:MAG: beta-ketoacyl synthase N-terminal-like domain-containing protein [Patescibacteria group bacterium]